MQHHRLNDVSCVGSANKFDWLARHPGNRMQPGVVTMADRWPRGYRPPDSHLPLESDARGSTLVQKDSAQGSAA